MAIQDSYLLLISDGPQNLNTTALDYANYVLNHPTIQSDFVRRGGDHMHGALTIGPAELETPHNIVLGTDGQAFFVNDVKIGNTEASPNIHIDAAGNITVLEDVRSKQVIISGIVSNDPALVIQDGSGVHTTIYADGSGFTNGYFTFEQGALFDAVTTVDADFIVANSSTTTLTGVVNIEGTTTIDAGLTVTDGYDTVLGQDLTVKQDATIGDVFRIGDDENPSPTPKAYGYYDIDRADDGYTLVTKEFLDEEIIRLRDSLFTLKGEIDVREPVPGDPYWSTAPNIDTDKQDTPLEGDIWLFVPSDRNGLDDSVGFAKPHPSWGPEIYDSDAGDGVNIAAYQTIIRTTDLTISGSGEWILGNIQDPNFFPTGSSANRGVVYLNDDTESIQNAAEDGVAATPLAVFNVNQMKVDRIGDTMTGNLIIDPLNGSFVGYLDGAAKKVQTQLTPGAYLNGTDYDGETARTFDVHASADNDPGTVVVRDGQGNFAAGDVTMEDLTVTNDAVIQGSLDVQGSIELSGDVGVGGDLTVVGDITGNKDLAITGDTTLSGPLDVNGSVTFDDTLFVANAVNFNGTLNVADEVTFQNNLDVGGTLEVSSKTTLGELEVKNKATFDDDVIINEDLYVYGDIIGYKDLSITQSATFGGLVTARTGILSEGNVDIKGDLDVAGNITVNGKGIVTDEKLIFGDHLLPPGGDFDGSAEVTLSIEAYSTNKPNELVLRDGQGDFSSRQITAERFNGPATEIIVQGSAAGTNFYVPFVSGSTGPELVLANNDFRYKADNGNLSIGGALISTTPLDNLSDVDINNPREDEILQYHNGVWENSIFEIPAAIRFIGVVDLTKPISDALNDSVANDASSRIPGHFWINDDGITGTIHTDWNGIAGEPCQGLEYVVWTYDGDFYILGKTGDIAPVLEVVGKDGITVDNTDRTHPEVGLELQPGVATGSYTNASITVNDRGIITSVGSGNITGQALIAGTHLAGNNYDGSQTETWTVEAYSTSVKNGIVMRDSNGDFTADHIYVDNIQTTDPSNIVVNKHYVDNSLSAGTGGTLIAGDYITGLDFNGANNVTWNVDGEDSNIPLTLVARDENGAFSAGTITAALNGNSSSSTKLETARTINGVPFDGTQNITITAAGGSKLTAGAYMTGGDYDGSAAVTFTVDGTPNNNANKVVARDPNGDFSARQITADKFVGTATTSERIITVREDNNGAIHPVVYVDSTTAGSRLPQITTGFHYRPSTGDLSIPGTLISTMELTDLDDVDLNSATLFEDQILQYNQGKWTNRRIEIPSAIRFIGVIDLTKPITDALNSSVPNDPVDRVPGWFWINDDGVTGEIHNSWTGIVPGTSQGLEYIVWTLSNDFYVLGRTGDLAPVLEIQAGDGIVVDASFDRTRPIVGIKTQPTIVEGLYTNPSVTVNEQGIITDISSGNTSGAKLTAGNYLTGSDYDGSSAVTWNVDATTSATPNKVVARDNNNDILCRGANVKEVYSTTGLEIKTADGYNMTFISGNSNSDYGFKKFNAAAIGVIRPKDLTTTRYYDMPDQSGVLALESVGEWTNVSDTVVRRNSQGESAFTSVQLDVNAPLADNNAVPKSYVDSRTNNGSSGVLMAGNYLTGLSYDGSADATWSVDGKTSPLSDSVVLRDNNGDVKVGEIECIRVTSLTDNSGPANIGEPLEFFCSTEHEDAYKFVNPYGSGVYWGGFNFKDITASRTYKWPNKSGTVALLDDLGSGGPEGTAEPTPNTLMLRDGTGSTEVVNLVATNTITAETFDSTSDERLKKNITTIEESTKILKEINGVRFTWNSNDEDTLGVIAQDVEKVLPELVKEDKDGMKSVNYNGLIGVLIQSVKELSERVEKLENQE